SPSWWARSCTSPRRESADGLTSGPETGVSAPDISPSADPGLRCTSPSVAGPPLVEGQVRDSDIVDVVAAHRVGAGDAVEDVGAAGTTEEERHDHVGVVVGVVLVGRGRTGLTGQSAVELALTGAGQVA